MKQNIKRIWSGCWINSTHSITLYEPAEDVASPSAELSIEAVSVRWFLQAVALVLTGMAALVAAAHYFLNLLE